MLGTEVPQQEQSTNSASTRLHRLSLSSILSNTPSHILSISNFNLASSLLWLCLLAPLQLAFPSQAMASVRCHCQMI